MCIRLMSMLELKRMQQLSVDGIFSDFPDRVREGSSILQHHHHVECRAE